MGENAEPGIRGEALIALQKREHNSQRGADHDHRQVDAHGQGQTQRDTEQGRVGEGIAEISHAPPHHKRA